MIRTAALLALTALAGCSMQPAYNRPATTVPPTWPTGDAYLRQSEAALPEYQWRGVFTDPRLQAVIADALSNNQDVARAAANIALARSQYQVQRAERLPTLDAGVGLNRSDNGSGASTRAQAELAVTGYEIDLFGRVKSLTDAAKNRYLASESAARAVKLVLVADVADAWLAYGADTSLLALAKDTAAAARESRRIAELRYKGGIAPLSDLRQAEIALTTAEADVANQTTLVAQDLNALRLLVGNEVAAANLPRSIDDATGQIAEVSAGLSSEVLLRRPDVVEAEWQLRAANAEIGAARAALFPRISLTGILGLASNALGGLFSGGNFTWSAGANAGYSIFSGGAGKANVRGSEAERDAALAGYRKAIQSAFADVANTLARRGTIDAQLAAARQGSFAANDNLRLAELRYRGGVDNYLQELTARLASYNAARTLVRTKEIAASNRVALYRALGGDGSL